MKQWDFLRVEAAKNDVNIRVYGESVPGETFKEKRIVTMAKASLPRENEFYLDFKFIRIWF